jgi:hypothetical protein
VRPASSLALARARLKLSLILLGLHPHRVLASLNALISAVVIGVLAKEIADMKNNAIITLIIALTFNIFPPRKYKTNVIRFLVAFFPV